MQYVSRISMRILLLTPPMTQLNTPYPATAYLTGFLRERFKSDVFVSQADPAIELFLKLFSHDGFSTILASLRERAEELGVEDSYDDVPPSVAHFLRHGETCVSLIEPVIRFLQGKDPSLALRIARGNFLPEGPRFESLRTQKDWSASNDRSRASHGQPFY
jgi:hypothetical protein